MARYKGIADFSGKIGDVIFVNKKNTKFAKAKRTEPINQTEASKKSSTDFGRASTAAAKIRKTLAPLLSFYGDDTLINRLNSRLMAVFNTIPKEFIGKKTLIQGDVCLLMDFPFNKPKKVDSLLYRGPEITILSSGKMLLEIPPHAPLEFFRQVPKATSVVMEFLVYNMDVEGNEDELIPINPLAIPFSCDFGGAKLTIPLVLSGDRIVIIGMGLHYLNGTTKIGSQQARAGSILFANKFRDGVVLPFIPAPSASIITEEKIQGLSWDF